jgi:hypothetical protein
MLAPELALKESRQAHSLVLAAFANLLPVNMLELILGSLGVPVNVVVAASLVLNDIVNEFGLSDDCDKLVGSIEVENGVRWVVNITSGGERLSGGAKDPSRSTWRSTGQF